MTSPWPWLFSALYGLVVLWTIASPCLRRGGAFRSPSLVLTLGTRPLVEGIGQYGKPTSRAGTRSRPRRQGSGPPGHDAGGPIDARGACEGLRRRPVPWPALPDASVRRISSELV